MSAYPAMREVTTPYNTVWEITGEELKMVDVVSSESQEHAVSLLMTWLHDHQDHANPWDIRSIDVEFSSTINDGRVGNAGR